MTIRKKIVLHFTALTAIILLLFGCLLYLFTKKNTERQFLERMILRAGVAGKARFEADSSNLSFYNEIRNKHLQLLPEEKEYFFTNAGEAEKFLPAKVSEAVKTKLTHNNVMEIRDNGLWYVGIEYHHQNTNSLIVLSATDINGEQILSSLAGNLVIGFLIALALVGITSYLLAREVVGPITNIINSTKKITASNLHLRLPITGNSVETTALSQTFNDMLDRLETSFETQNNFLNKAAHELRTPLTAIKGEAELALHKSRTEEEYVTALRVIFQVAEQMEHHSSSLLELAQAGYNAREPFMADIRVDELIFSVKRLVDLSEPANKVQLNLDTLPESEEEITIKGNTNLLRLAIANIIQNACKYSGQQPVSVSLHADASFVSITVKDEGIGIPENEIKYIFDPFFRASNTTPFKGYGVGLPLAQKIIRLHRGELRYHSRENAGTTVQILLPNT